MTEIDITKLRASIDEVDQKIIALLRERCTLVKQVGMTKKARQVAGKSFIRSGREADMLRRMYSTFSKEAFPAQAAAHLWRIIIAASLSLESSLNISAFWTDARQDVYWLAREYFGNFTPISRQGAARRVVGDVVEEKAEVGALPMPDSSSAEENWWLKLPENVKIFACVPFIISGDAMPAAVLIARTEPEPTGDDITLISIETREDVSQSRLKAIFDRHQITVNWISAESFPSGHRAHLIEMKGFYTAQDEVLLTLAREVDTSLVALRHLGGYAVPIRY